MIGAADDIRYRVPDAPSIGRSLRAATADFYFNSWRLVPANVIWGALFLLLTFATLAWLPAAVLFSLLALPVAGLYRVAALIERGHAVGLGDAITGMRQHAGAALVVGVASMAAAVVLAANIAIGMALGGIAGGVFAMLAGYGLVALGTFLVAAWPLIVDPLREGVRLTDRLRLAFLVIATRPTRMLALTLVILLILAVSTVLFAALLTISVAYVALVATRYVLPVADRIEGRATLPIPT